MRNPPVEVSVVFFLSGLVLAGCSGSVSGTSSRPDSADGGGGKPTIGAVGGPCTSGGSCDPGLHCASGTRVCVSAPGSGGSTSSGGAGGAGGATVTTGGGGSPSGGALSQGGAGAGGSGRDGGAAGAGGAVSCDAVFFPSDRLPVDMYVMFDKSSSMNDPVPGGSGTWWSGAQAALTSFVTDNSAAGTGVGLQYFPLSSTLPACSVASSVGDCCSSNVYQSPAVPIGLLPGGAAALTASIQSTYPTTFTPTSAALQGAIAYMKAWAPGHLGRAPVVVLVTDGFPTECSAADPTTGASVSDLAAQAKVAFETDPKVRTAVVALNLGTAGSNLNEIAKAGGTAQAYLADNPGSLATALLGITGVPSCEMPLPKPMDAGTKLDPSLVSVVLTPSATGVTVAVSKVNTSGDCALNGNEGFYFDSPATPTQIVLCPGTCGAVYAGSVGIGVGCPPVPGITR